MCDDFPFFVSFGATNPSFSLHSTPPTHPTPPTPSFDHIVAISDDEIEGSDTASTFSAYSSIDFGDENRSRSGSILSDSGTPTGTPTSPFGRKRVGSPRAAQPNLETLKEVPSTGDLASALAQAQVSQASH
jgi:hypothetical protein